MKLLARALFTVAALALASAAQARPSIAIITGGCGSPALSKSTNARFRLDPGKTLCFKNDVGDIVGLTLESDASFPDLDVAPESELKTLQVSRDGRTFRLSGGSIRGPEFFIRIEPRQRRVVVKVRSFKTAPHP